LIFTQLAAAYEIVGSPDKRAVFDDFGTTDMTSEDSAGFQDYAEYAASGRKATRDFYTAEECVLIWLCACLPACPPQPAPPPVLPARRGGASC
jgi:curved DNA-binding protein CbpA